MYKSPIEVLTTGVWHEINEHVDKQVTNILMGLDIRVDKPELLRALGYDRGQYDKGYADGLMEGASMLPWVSVKDTLPLMDGQMYVCFEYYNVVSVRYVRKYGICTWESGNWSPLINGQQWNRSRILYWMHIPPLPSEESDT